MRPKTIRKSYGYSGGNMISVYSSTGMLYLLSLCVAFTAVAMEMLYMMFKYILESI